MSDPRFNAFNMRGTPVPYSETMPHAFDRSVDFNGSTSDHPNIDYEGALGGGGLFAGGMAGAASVLKNALQMRRHGLPQDFIKHLLRMTAYTSGGGAIGGAAGSVADHLARGAPMIPRSANNYREMSNPDGSEERIGRGLSGPVNPEGPYHSRPPKMFGI